MLIEDFVFVLDLGIIKILRIKYMHAPVHAEPLHQKMSDKVLAKTGENVAMCYQCGKCSAGCPLNDEMDIAPNQILRLLQLGLPGMEDEILGSLGIWLCLSCETCYTRCPKDVDLPVVMDYLRSESMRKGKVHPKAKDIIAFHRTFLDSLRLTGRLYEVGLIAGYKMRTGHLMQDVAVAPSMFMKGKLNLFPHFIKNKSAIARMFEKTQGRKEGE